MISPIDFVLHIDKYLGLILQDYGALSYLILFLIIFFETGIVITPFLPGDSLIFIAGAFAAAGAINVLLLFFVLTFAAIIGDSVNYWIGGFLGEKFFEKSVFFRKDYLTKTKAFYKKHGGKTIIIARFIPIIRTFAPFVAGIGKMDYLRFLSFNVVGGTIWVALFIFAGYFFGAIPFVQDNLNWIVWTIIFISILPVIFEFIRHKMKK